MRAPELVKEDVAMKTVVRPPFWMASPMVTAGKARSGLLNDANSCLQRSLSKIEQYYGKETSKYTGSGVNQAPQVCCSKLDHILEINLVGLKSKLDVWEV